MILLLETTKNVFFGIAILFFFVYKYLILRTWLHNLAWEGIIKFKKIFFPQRS